jgi:hypothetical protein
MKQEQKQNKTKKKKKKKKISNLELRQRSIGLHGAKQRVCKTSESGANERHIIDCGAKLHRVLKLFGHLCNNVNNTKDTRKSTKTEERKKKKKKKKKCNL